MSEINERVSALLKSPLGCAFLWSADALGLTAKEIAEPIDTLHLGASAAELTGVWRSEPERDTERAPLSRATVRRPGPGSPGGTINRVVVWATGQSEPGLGASRRCPTRRNPDSHSRESSQ